MHLGDLALSSAVKLNSVPKAIASGRTNKSAYKTFSDITSTLRRSAEDKSSCREVCRKSATLRPMTKLLIHT